MDMNDQGRVAQCEENIRFLLNRYGIRRQTRIFHSRTDRLFFVDLGELGVSDWGLPLSKKLPFHGQFSRTQRASKLLHGRHSGPCWRSIEEPSLQLTRHQNWYLGKKREEQDGYTYIWEAGIDMKSAVDPSGVLDHIVSEVFPNLWHDRKTDPFEVRELLRKMKPLEEAA